MKDPYVSVIIPTYNEEQNISRCLESILDQSYQKEEVIIVDDGSNDNTVEQIKKFPVKLLKQPHGGPAKARNLGAKEARGDILVFMDADMSFDKNFLKELAAPIIDGQYKGTFSKEEYVSNWDNTWARCWNINLGLFDKRIIPKSYPDEGMDFRAILKSEFLKAGGFSDTGYTDTWSLYQKLGYKPRAVTGAVYYHFNPDNLAEVFIQAKWRSKRGYKLGILGKIIAVIRSFLLFSLVTGIFKSFQRGEPRFLIFKIIYDFGSFLGILEMIFWGKLSK